MWNVGSKRSVGMFFECIERTTSRTCARIWTVFVHCRPRWLLDSHAVQSYCATMQYYCALSELSTETGDSTVKNVVSFNSTGKMRCHSLSDSLPDCQDSFRLPGLQDRRNNDQY